MRHTNTYQPKRLAGEPSPASLGLSSHREERYSAYILPQGAAAVTAADLERFPPIPLGDETAARAWLDRALPEGPTPLPAAEKRRRFWRDAAYYAALAALVLAVFLFRGTSGGQPVTFAGFSAMRVLTTSMEEVIPQGSLIITRHVDPNTLELGDDITYMIAQDATVTHRVVDITENYQGTGQRAFTTQGVMNPDPDRLLVPADNVVGKVVFHSLFLGRALELIRRHWTWLALLLGLGLGLVECLRVLVRESRGERGRRTRPQTAGAYKK